MPAYTMISPFLLPQKTAASKYHTILEGTSFRLTTTLCIVDYRDIEGHLSVPYTTCTSLCLTQFCVSFLSPGAYLLQEDVGHLTSGTYLYFFFFLHLAATSHFAKTHCILPLSSCLTHALRRHCTCLRSFDIAALFCQFLLFSFLPYHDTVPLFSTFLFCHFHNVCQYCLALYYAAGFTSLIGFYQAATLILTGRPLGLLVFSHNGGCTTTLHRLPPLFHSQVSLRASLHLQICISVFSGTTASWHILTA